MRYSFTFHFLAGRNRIEVRVQLGTRRQWADHPESRSPYWVARRVGRIVVAVAAELVEPADPTADDSRYRPAAVPSLN